MSTQHTPEPWDCYQPSEQDQIKRDATPYAPKGVIWRISGRKEIGGPYVGLLFKSHSNEPDPTEADVRRIVACVNACKGLSNDILEKIAQRGGQRYTTEGRITETLQVRRDYPKVVEQRDRLLAVLGPLLSRAERSEVIIDSEYGMRDLAEIEKEGDLPAEILNARVAIAAATQPTEANQEPPPTCMCCKELLDVIGTYDGHPAYGHEPITSCSFQDALVREDGKYRIIANFPISRHTCTLMQMKVCFSCHGKCSGN